MFYIYISLYGEEIRPCAMDQTAGKSPDSDSTSTVAYTLRRRYTVFLRMETSTSEFRESTRASSIIGRYVITVVRF